MLCSEQVFNAGHRIRVTVACTGLPLYETGGNGTDEEAGRVEVRALPSSAFAAAILSMTPKPHGSPTPFSCVCETTI